MVDSGDETHLPNEGRGERSALDAQVYYLDHALWRRLSETHDTNDLFEAWLELQCRMIDGVAAGLVMIGAPEGSSFPIRSIWPAASKASPRLIEVASLSLEQRRGVIRRPPGNSNKRIGSDRTALAFPFVFGDEVIGAVAVEVAEGPAQDAREVMRQLQWGGAWVDRAVSRRENVARAQSADLTNNAFSLVATALEEASFFAASFAVATALAEQLDCERVSLGFRRRGHCSVVAMSQSPNVAKRMNLIRALGASMDEALDQQTTLLYPPTDGQFLAVTAHQILSEVGRAGSLLTVPLSAGEHYFGAVTCERVAASPFTQADLDYLEIAACLIGPILEERRKNDRWLIVKVADSVWRQAAMLMGPRYLGRKLVGVAALAAAFFLIFAEADYRVSAPARLEGSVRRVVASPAEGYILSERVRAGDIVTKGQILAELDDRDLRLEHRGWTTVRQQRLREFDEALADGKRASMNVIRAQIEQAEAKMATLEEQLSRTKLIAPFDGLVIAGDLSQSIGRPVERGEILFEVAPLDAYRVILEVDETVVDDVRAGQSGSLVLSSLPERPFDFVVDRVTPIAEAAEGRNFFIVEASLGQNEPQLRPGMKGLGKIEIDRRKLAWIWTHDLVDFMRIKIWAWQP